MGAVSTEQNTRALTPLLQLQKRLESSGASLDTLDLSYKQCVAARKLRHGEVCHKWFDKFGGRSNTA